MPERSSTLDSRPPILIAQSSATRASIMASYSCRPPTSPPQPGNRTKVRAQVYDLNNYQRVLIVGAGKASARMAQALENLFGK